MTHIIEHIIAIPVAAGLLYGVVRLACRHVIQDVEQRLSSLITSSADHDLSNLKADVATVKHKIATILSEV